MKSSLAVAAAALTVALAGCGDSTDAAKTPSVEAASKAPTRDAKDGVETEASTSSAIASNVSTTVTRGTPAFAEIYPDARVDGAPVSATGQSGQGGMVTFTTPAPPEKIIDFYRQRAEAAGLAPMSALNQGDTRGYGAIQQETGASVNVVASPVEGAGTSVQLTWSAGQ